MGTINDVIVKLCFVFFLFMFCLHPLQAEDKPYNIFTIDNLIKPSWGELVAVFDQKNSQRLTFDNEKDITMVLINLTWDSKVNGFIPKVRQIIHLKKVVQE